MTLLEHQQRADVLRRQVTCREMPKFNGVAIISGNAEMGNEEIRGSDLFQPEVRIQNKAWIWRKRGIRPTADERQRCQDWPGISDGDPITWGHLEALGFEVKTR